MQNSSITIKYHYSTFKNLTIPCECNFYGVIFDASFPIPDEFVESRYECTLKLIDPTVNCLTNPLDINDQLINLIIKSSEKESIPYAHHIGDIIRVHRANYAPKKKRNVYLQMNKSNHLTSSWCIFSGASDVLSRDMNPYLCSHSHFTFEYQDKTIIDNMRNWIRLYFLKQDSLLYGKDSKLGNREKVGSDNDAVIQIVHKQELLDKLVFFVQDETDGCELHTFKYYNFIKVNDVIRLRSFKIFNKNVILMNTFSNILKIPQFSDYYKQFMNRLVLRLRELQPNVNVPLFPLSSDLKGTKDGDGIGKGIEKLKEKKHYIIRPIVKEGQYDLKQYTDIVPTDKRFLLEVNVIEIYPKPVYNSVNVLCQNCKYSYMISEIEFKKTKFVCEQCKGEGVNNFNLHFNATLQCRENLLTNEVITLHLCTFDNEGNNFFGIPPVDAYRNSTAFLQIGEAFKKITQSTAYVLVLVEQYNEKVLRIVGQYEHSV